MSDTMPTSTAAGIIAMMSTRARADIPSIRRMRLNPQAKAKLEAERLEEADALDAAFSALVRQEVRDAVD